LAEGYLHKRTLVFYIQILKKEVSYAVQSIPVL